MHVMKIEVGSEWGGEDYGGGIDIAVVISSNPIDMDAIESVINKSSLSDENGPDYVTFSLEGFEPVNDFDMDKFIETVQADQHYHGMVWEIRLDDKECFVHQDESHPMVGRFDVTPQWFSFR